MPAPKSKADIGLYISPEVFQLPLPFITRGILAEIHQLSKRDGVCTASDAHFVERFGVSLDTVWRAIQQLAAAGVIHKEVDKLANNLRRISPVSDQNLTRKIRGTLPAKSGEPTRKIRGTLPAKSGAMISKKNKKEDNIHSDAASRRVGGASFHSENGEHEGQHDASGKGAEPGGSTDEQKERLRREWATEAAMARAGREGEPPGFAEFFDEWPTKQKRKDAARAFAGLSSDDQQQAAARAARWLTQHPRQVERGAAPHPATWLRGEQWNDGPEPKDRSSKGQPGAVATTARTNAAATIKKQQTGDWK